MVEKLRAFVSIEPDYPNIEIDARLPPAPE
jgi:hypothetical protein